MLGLSKDEAHLREKRRFINRGSFCRQPILLCSPMLPPMYFFWWSTDFNTKEQATEGRFWQVYIWGLPMARSLIQKTGKEPNIFCREPMILAGVQVAYAIALSCVPCCFQACANLQPLISLIFAQSARAVPHRGGAPWLSMKESVVIWFQE